MQTNAPSKIEKVTKSTSEGSGWVNAPASGMWSAENTFTLKIVLYETPFYSTVNFKFDGDSLVIDSEQNVAFGPTKMTQLVGKARATE